MTAHKLINHPAADWSVVFRLSPPRSLLEMRISAPQARRRTQCHTSTLLGLNAALPDAFRAWHKCCSVKGYNAGLDTVLQRWVKEGGAGLSNIFAVSVLGSVWLLEISCISIHYMSGRLEKSPFPVDAGALVKLGGVRASV